MFSSKPLVALGWSLLQARKLSYLPRKYQYIVPEHAIYEPATGRDPPGYIEKLRQLLSLNREQFFLARHWNHIVDLEPAPGQCIDRKQLVYVQAEAARSWDPEFWQSLILNAQTGAAELHEAKKAFDNIRNGDAHALIKAAQERNRGTFENTPWEDVFAAARLPHAMLGLLLLEIPRYELNEWKTVLSVFPDRHAIGRFFRLLFIYLLAGGIEVPTSPKRICCPSCHRSRVPLDFDVP